MVTKSNWTWFSKEEVASWPPEHKRCRLCREVLPFSEFHKNKHTLFGYNTECKKCRKPKSKKRYHETPPEQLLWERAKSRSALLGREFSIELSDVVIPDICPVLGIPITLRAGPNSPSLDRIDNSKGYVKGNVQVISNRANTIKGDATFQELEMVLLWMNSVVSSE